MADAHVRALERKLAKSACPRDRARWLRASLRAGLVDGERLTLAALAGHDAAREALDVHGPELAVEPHGWVTAVDQRLGSDGLRRVAVLLIEESLSLVGRSRASTFGREAMHLLRRGLPADALAHATFRWLAARARLVDDPEAVVVEAAGLFANLSRFDVGQAVALVTGLLGDRASESLVRWALSPLPDPLDAPADPERAPRVIVGERTVALHGGEVVGRGAVAFSFADPHVAREHARFEVVDGAAWIVTLSNVRTTVNGARVTGRRELAHGDVVTFGDTVGVGISYWA